MLDDCDEDIGYCDATTVAATSFSFATPSDDAVAACDDYNEWRCVRMCVCVCVRMLPVARGGPSHAVWLESSLKFIFRPNPCWLGTVSTS